MNNFKYSRMGEETYKKLLFQLRGQFGAILNCFRCYGLEPYVDGAIEECIELAENFGMAVRGKNKPIHILEKPKPSAIDDVYNADD